MGETVTCLMQQQQPFSYTAGISDEAKEGNLFSSLGQSVSFGRFNSESLSWEKWSSFSSNKYVEEAEKYSRPGSVAEKKAFFEAHYRNLAARKAAAEAAAAALLEQGNGAKMEESESNEANEANPSVENRASKSKEEGNGDGEVDGREAMEKPLFKVTRTKSKGSARKSEPAEANEGRKQMEKPLLKVMRTKSKGSARKSHELEQKKANESNPPAENRAFESACVKVGALSKVEAVESKEESTNQIEKPLLKDFISNGSDSDTTTKKKPAVSFSSNLIVRRKAPAARNESMNATTPISKTSSTTTPKSTQKKAMTFTPVREINRITSSIIRKIDGSRAGFSHKPTAAKEYSSSTSTPFRTPSRDESKKLSESTPQPESWARTPLHPSAANSGSKTVRPRWHFLPTDCSKFMSGSRNKSQQSPSFSSTPFSLRTEERAARRKGKLEEKFNANQAQKVQLQSTVKEKAETEMKKLRKSLCFKARPLPGFYKQKVTPKNQTDKVPLTHPSPSPQQETSSTAKMARNAATATTPQIVHRSSSKNSNSGRHLKKSDDNDNNNNPRCLRARLRATAAENTSPNIIQQQQAI